MIDHAVKDIASSRPRLRGDVKISPRVEGGETIYLMEDSLTGKFFHLGENEYSMIRMLDGRRTINEIVALTVSGPAATGLGEQDAVSLLRILSESNLLESESDDQSSRIRRDASDKRDPDKALGEAKSLFFIKIPLLNPDRFFRAVHALTGKIPGFVFFLFWLAAIAAAVGAYLQEADRFGEEAAGILQVENFALLGVVWLVLKVVHEFCHGIVCKRYGGSIPEAGLSLLLFVTPLAFVDCSSSLRFASKWKRIHVAAAGILGEFFVASFALIAWAHLPPGQLGSVLHQVVMISTVTTVLSNANPLMRFDGYYILSDLLGIPNLSTKGQQAVKYGMKRWLLGIGKISSPFREDEKKTGIIVLYGIAAALWKVVVTVGLFVAAVVCLKGAGFLLAALVGTAMLIGALRGASKYLKRTAAAEETGFWKISVRLGALSLLVSGLLIFVKISPGITIPGVLHSGRENEIRVECPGFVEEVLVANGDLVSKGDLLVRLGNQDVALSLGSLEAEMEQSAIRSNLYFSAEQVSAYQAEENNLSGLRTRVADMRNFLSTLELRAPRDGVVYGSRLGDLRGTFLTEGEVAAKVIAAGESEILLAISQTEMKSLKSCKAGDDLEIFSPASGRKLSATLSRIHPGASLAPPHPAMVSSGGGPLVVRRISGGAGKKSPKQEELTVPHFFAYAKAKRSGGTPMQEGQLVWGRLSGGESQSLGHFLGGRLSNWITDRITLPAL